MTIQIFGTKNSQPARAAERFFKERGIAIQFVDLNRKPMAPGEIKRFVERFGLDQLLDTEGAAYQNAGLKYLKMSAAETLGAVERDPKLLRLPLVRSGNRLSIGSDAAGWAAMLASR
jgi:arsenate reductase (glutaredoxin)